MFKPIKDFITFIQKNTSANGAENEIDEGSNTMDKIKIEENRDKLQEKLLTPDKDANRVIMETTKNCLVTTTNVTSLDFDEDDIELHIKSSIMLKNSSLKCTTTSSKQTMASSICSVSSLPCSPIALSSTYSKPYEADYNQNLRKNAHHISPEDDDELSDFKNDPLQAPCREFYTINTTVEETHITSSDEVVDKLQTEGEDILDDTYSEERVKDGVFVVIESTLNSSIASSNVDDPLIIDINGLPANTDEVTNPLDNPTNEENDEMSSVNGLNWLETEENTATISSIIKLQSNEIKRISNQTVIQEKRHSTENHRNTSISLNVSQSEELSEEIERCDNSDSGLGTETSSLLLQTTLNSSVINNSSYGECNELTPTSVTDGSIATDLASSSSALLPDVSIPPLKPLRSNLKRRYNHEVSVEANNLLETSNTKVDDIFQPKKPKRSINFDAVQVYYFPRQQGFGCVPSAGGCTLGMGSQHVDFKRLTLAEHAAELRRAHRLQLQEVNPRGSSSEETDESEEDYLSEGSGSDLDADSNGFLQPVPPKQRRAILKAAGVRKIDTSEKIDCRNIRNSREVCGCTCRDFCDPETCSCSRSGIKCQVDRAMFPCGCSRDACGNTTGRVEFNPARVRTHFIHTIMRLDMENRQQQQPIAVNGPASSCGYDSPSSSAATSAPPLTMSSGSNTSNHNGYYNMQTQSNYSSGYASPSYSNEHNANYYQQQSVTYANTSDVTTNVETPYHSLDSVDSNIFANTTSNPLPSYGEIISNYCPNSSTGALQISSTVYHSSLAYTTTYMSYQHNQHHDNNSSYLTTPPLSSSNSTNNSMNNTVDNYSSCAVPSQQPYGIATTCSSTTTTDTNDGNFINLSTPITRLSQINDLLQHNRNTTAALVAVSHHSGDSPSSTANDCATTNSNLNGSIKTPPINETQKSCFAFNSDLVQSSITTNSEETRSSPQSKPPDLTVTPRSPIEYDSRAAIADYAI